MGEVRQSWRRTRCDCVPGKRCEYHREYHRLWKEDKRRAMGVPASTRRSDPPERPSLRCYKTGCGHDDCRALNAARIRKWRLTGSTRNVTI